MNIDYKTSKDYNKLVSLIKSGLHVVCFATHGERTDICWARFTESEESFGGQVSSRGVGHISYCESEQEFIESCKVCKLEFIKPIPKKSELSKNNKEMIVEFNNLNRHQKRNLIFQATKRNDKQKWDGVPKLQAMYEAMGYSWIFMTWIKKENFKGVCSGVIDSEEIDLIEQRIIDLPNDIASIDEYAKKVEEAFSPDGRLDAECTINLNSFLGFNF